MKISKLLMGAFVFLSTISSHGGHEGNGGDVVVCMKDEPSYNQLRENLVENYKSPVELKQDPFRNGLIDKIQAPVRMLDLWNVPNLREVEADWQEEMKRVKEALDEAVYLVPMIEDVEKSTDWKESSSGVLEISDSNHKTPMPGKCIVIQMAYQDWVSPSYQMVYFDIRLWNLMEAADKLALRLHEPLAHIERKTLKREDTSLTRLTVASILSADFYDNNLESFKSLQQKLSFLNELDDYCEWKQKTFLDIEGKFNACINKDKEVKRLDVVHGENYAFYDKYLHEKVIATPVLNREKENSYPTQINDVQFLNLEFSSGIFSKWTKLVNRLVGLKKTSNGFFNLDLNLPKAINMTRKLGHDRVSDSNFAEGYFVSLENVDFKQRKAHRITSNIELIKTGEVYNSDKIVIKNTERSKHSYKFHSETSNVSFRVYGIGQGSFVCKKIRVNSNNILEYCEVDKRYASDFSFLPEQFSNLGIEAIKFYPDGNLKMVNATGNINVHMVSFGKIDCMVTHNSSTVLHPDGSLRKCEYAKGQTARIGKVDFPLQNSMEFHPTGQLKSGHISSTNSLFVLVDDIYCGWVVKVYPSGKLKSCVTYPRFNKAIKLSSYNKTLHIADESSIEFHPDGMLKKIKLRKAVKLGKYKLKAGQIYFFDEQGYLDFEKL